MCYFTGWNKANNWGYPPSEGRMHTKAAKRRCSIRLTHVFSIITVCARTFLNAPELLLRRHNINWNPMMNNICSSVCHRRLEERYLAFKQNTRHKAKENDCSIPTYWRLTNGFFFLSSVLGRVALTRRWACLSHNTFVVLIVIEKTWYARNTCYDKDNPNSYLDQVTHHKLMKLGFFSNACLCLFSVNFNGR